MQGIYQIIDYATYLSPLVLLSGIILQFKNYRFFTSPYKIVFVYLTLQFLIDVFSRIYSYFFLSNLIFISIANIIELLCLFGFLKVSSSNLHKNYNLFFAIVLLYNIYEIVTIDYYDFKSFHTYSRTVNCIFLLFITINKVINNLKKEIIHKRVKVKLFLILFFTVGAILNLPLNLLVNNDNLMVYIFWLIHVVNYIMLYIVLNNYLSNYNKVNQVKSIID